MYRFHISLHPMPIDSKEGEFFHDDYGQWSTVTLLPSMLADPFKIFFDQYLERLGMLDRLFVEPDGSFVWRGVHDSLEWQVDGNAVERLQRVQMVELKGTCTEAGFDQLLKALEWPATVPVVQLVRAGAFLKLSTFRLHAKAFAEGSTDKRL